MPGFTKHLTIVVPAGLQARCNQLAAEIDTGGAGHLTFTVGLHPTGRPDLNPTHYWCGWQVTAEQHAALLARFGGETPGRPGRVFDGHAVGPEAVLQTMGLERRSGLGDIQVQPPSVAAPAAIPAVVVRPPLETEAPLPPAAATAPPPSAAELTGVGLTTAFLPRRGRRAWWLLIPAGLLAAGAAAAGLGGVEWIEQVLKFLGLT